MDAPDVPRDELDGALTFLRQVNARLGGSALLLRSLSRWSRNWPTDRPVTLLDIATGSADIPVAARRWAIAKGFDLRVTGIDAHETTLTLAREHVQHELGRDTDAITLHRADARQLIEVFGPQSFDYVHAGLFLHHLPDIEVLTVLRIMERLARRGIIWSDLWRSPFTALGVRLVSMRAPDIVKHDGRVSVQAGFTLKEVRDIRQRLSLSWCALRCHPTVGRFTLAGQRQGAWKL